MESAKQSSDSNQMYPEWVKDYGISIDGVHIAKTLCGQSVLANRQIKKGDVLVRVPNEALVTIHSVPMAFRERQTGMSVHGILASFSYLLSLSGGRYKSWEATWPSRQEMQQLPIQWPADCKQNLPTDVRDGILRNQEKKFLRDWEIMKEVHSETTKSEFLYYWLIVNTRSFYFRKGFLDKETAHEDCLALCPFIDFFNHQDHGCEVSFDAHEFSVTAQQDYEPGNEVFTCYGAHSNDFLLVEYGFILSQNKWDFVQLDFLVNALCENPAMQLLLGQNGYKGRYALNSDGVCYRTHVAARLRTLDSNEWHAFVEGRLDETLMQESDAARVISEEIVHKLHVKADEMTNFISLHRERDKSPWDLLYSRWLQIKQIASNNIRAHDNYN